MKGVYLTILLSVFFNSCKKDNMDENTVIINDKETKIEFVRLVIFEGATVTGLKEFSLEFYGPGVTLFKDKHGYDSIVYEDNTFGLYYNLYKPKDSVAFKGEYNWYDDCYPYTTDSAYSFYNSGFFDSKTNGNGVNYLAVSGKVVIRENNGIFDIDFNFIRYGDEYWPEDIYLDGSYKGILVTVFK